MLATVSAAAEGFVRPEIDWHAFAPELVVLATFVVVLLVDVFTDEHSRWTASSFAGVGLLAAIVPLLTLAMRDGDSVAMFGGGYVVDDFSLVLKALFLVAGYITVLISSNQIAEGDYHEGEYYLLVLASLFGMMAISSARDLITIFVAFEMLSIPTYMLAAWRKRTQTGIEAGMKYYLIGVFATGVMLYGMSLIYGGTGSVLLSDIGAHIAGDFGQEPVAVVGILFTLVGFLFKVSAVPFHNWAPDTYEGAPTPVTAFLSVASKSAGFVAILQLVFLGFFGRADVIRPLMFLLAVLTMTIGNVIALRQTNIVRMFAYSSVAQAGFILVPLSVLGSGPAGTSSQVLASMVTYLLVYTVVNLGAFAVIVAVSRRTGSGEIASWGGLFTYAPALALSMGAFLFALGGIPPAVGWFAKFQLFTAVVNADTALGYAAGVAMAVNSVVSLGYYLGVMRTMFMDDVPDGDTTPVRVPPALVAAVGITAVLTLVVGFLPGLVGDLADHATFALSLGE